MNLFFLTGQINLVKNQHNGFLTGSKNSLRKGRGDWEGRFHHPTATLPDQLGLVAKGWIQIIKILKKLFKDKTSGEKQILFGRTSFETAWQTFFF